MIGPGSPHVTVDGFDGPLDLLLELALEKRLDIQTVRLAVLADDYLARVRAVEALPAEEVAAFLHLASRLVLLKARSLLPSPQTPVEESPEESEEELRARLIEYAAVRERASLLADRLRAGERAFHREGGTVELPPRGGSSGALAAAGAKALALAVKEPPEQVAAPGERYSVEDRTAEIASLLAERGRISFSELLGDGPTLGFAIVTFIALLDLHRGLVAEIDQDELFGEIVVTARERRAGP
ncbi:MAG: segregation/condensation protein A [Chloroflexota bacterium]|nr:segregation/condensation protein A [Chloroflexota bacterium]